jgi:hypothetical protein
MGPSTILASGSDLVPERFFDYEQRKHALPHEVTEK